MTLRILVFSFISILFYSCAQEADRQERRNEPKLKGVVSEIEAELVLLNKEITSIKDHYAFLLANRDSVLKSDKPNKYHFENGYSSNRPGTDTTLSSIVILQPEKSYEEKLLEVQLTNSLDSVFSHILDRYSFVSQVYSNSSNQVSRVFPAYDASALLTEKINLTSYNFFYLGNSANNPSKGSVWISDAYVDPAGRGWILSVIQPIYDKESLFAVVGIDITVEEIITRYLEKQNENYLIVTKTGDIVAARPETIELLSFSPLRNYIYRNTIKEDNYRISDFNLFKSKNSEVRQMAEKLFFEDKSYFTFKEDFSPVSAQKAPFELLDWILIEIIPSKP